MAKTLELLYIIIGSGLGSFFTQKLFEHRLNKKLFKFTKLHSEKLDTYRNLYKLLIRTEKALEILLNQKEPIGKTVKEKYYKETTLIINEFIDTFEENEIIFEDSIIERTTTIINIFRQAKNIHFIANSFESDRGSQAWEKAVSQKQELANKLGIEFPILKKTLKRKLKNAISD